LGLDSNCRGMKKKYIMCCYVCGKEAEIREDGRNSSKPDPKPYAREQKSTATG